MVVLPAWRPSVIGLLLRASMRFLQRAQAFLAQSWVRSVDGQMQNAASSPCRVNDGMIEEPIIKEHGLTERQVLAIYWSAHECAFNRNAMPGGRELLPEEREQLEAKQ